MLTIPKKLLPRVIPVLLIQSRGNLVKTVRFREPAYIGDPLNAVKIFNEKEVDELIIMDISATRENREPDYAYIEQIATECFMPVTYGGGVKSSESFQRVISCGIEKVALNTACYTEPNLIRKAADIAGSSSVVAVMDIKKDWLGRRNVFMHHTGKTAGKDLPSYARNLEFLGAGEILIQSVDLDGTMLGYDLPLVQTISAAVNVPVIACGGAGTIEHFSDALRAGASAVASGSKFVFRGKHRAVLINYLSAPEMNQLETLLR